MKKAFVPVLLAGALLATMAGCGKGNENTAVTENSDPAEITSEKVDRTAWTSAFKSEPNFSVKSVVNVDLTQDGETRRETVTYVYRFTADKIALTMKMAEGGKPIYEAEGYLETKGDAVSFWQRAKESDEKEWQSWDGETYEKKDLPEIFSVMEGLSFAGDNYANFSYSDAEKGYLATTSGLAEMQGELNDAVSALLAGTVGDLDGIGLEKLVLKINGGKPSACILSAEIEGAQDDTQEGTQNGGSQNGSQEGNQNGSQEGMQEGNQNGAQDGMQEGAQDPASGARDGAETGNGDTMSGEEGDGNLPETAPAAGKVTLTQLYYGYGTTSVTRPEGLPSLDGDEAPAKTRRSF